MVDLVGVAVEEAGAGHRLRGDQRGRDHGDEAVRDGAVDGQVEQAELEPGAGAGEEVEARAADLGAAVEVDGAEPLAEGDMVEGLEALGGEVARGCRWSGGR